jgi:hypothetical protein
MWVLVIMVTLHGGLYNSSPAVAMTKVPGYMTEAQCLGAAKKAVSDFGEKAQTSCVPLQK